MCEIIIKDLSFSYGREAVLKNVSLTIKKGEFVVIVGPNGAGKSTLVKIIVGLLAPQNGQVFLNRMPVAKAQAQGLVSYVPQNYEKGGAGFPATVEEIVALGLVNARQKINKKAAREIIARMLKLADAEDLKNRRLSELSGGQRQRVIVAAALAGNPELLVLDEPTSGIDFNASSKIQEALGELNKKLGVTIVMVSHDLDNATRFAGQVLCINRTLCFAGTSEEFRANHEGVKHLFF